MEYKEFLENKIVIADNYGIEIKKEEINPIALPHQKNILYTGLFQEVGGLYSLLLV